MSKTDDFIKSLESSTLVTRIQELKSLIESVPEYREHFQEILDFQKQVVRQTYKPDGFLESNLERWSDRLALFASDPNIQEYLELVEILNDIILRIQEILNSEISL
ncbi:MAG: YlbF family regulator [Bacilli bacterium]|nr:YlbF family regulator [Bacilli bacterium]